MGNPAGVSFVTTEGRPGECVGPAERVDILPPSTCGESDTKPVTLSVFISAPTDTDQIDRRRKLFRGGGGDREQRIKEH